MPRRFTRTLWSMAEEKGRSWGPLIAFVVVAAGVYLVGKLATALLENVILPIAAILAGYVVARAVHRLKD